MSCSRVIGKRRTRTPVACDTALAMAPAVPVIPISPTPLMPSAFTYGSVSSMRMASSDGTSALTGTWYSARFAFMTRPDRGSSTACSCNANETPQIMPLILAAHEPRVDDGAGCEGADTARRPDLAELRVHLHLGEDSAVRVHGVGLLRERIRAASGRVAPAKGLRIRGVAAQLPKAGEMMLFRKNGPSGGRGQPVISSTYAANSLLGGAAEFCRQ